MSSWAFMEPAVRIAQPTISEKAQNGYLKKYSINIRHQESTSTEALDIFMCEL
jgi:hypothetical protein